MSPAEETMDEIPPTYRFRPTQRELVEFYLLPRARRQDPFPGVIIEDDTAGSSLPWDLFERHGLGTEDEAYFFVRASDATKKRGARQDRGCDGGVGSWKMQNSRVKGLRVGGEKISCRKSNLNLHMGKGKNGGSVGWVMHEYTIAAPPCPSPVKICHIAFTGHGRKRERVPGAQEDCQTGQALPQVDAAAAGGGCSGGMPDDRDSGALVHASADEEGSQPVLTKDNIFSQNPVLGGSEFLGFPSTASANAEQYHYQELEQEVPSNLWSSTWLESNNVVPHISDHVVQQLNRVQEDYQTGQASQVDAAAAAGGCSGAMLDCDSGTVVNVSADEECSQPVLNEDIFSLSPLLDSSEFLGSPSPSSANADQYQELEQVVPSTEEEQAMVPQLMVEQSVSSLEEQQYAGALEFWSSTGVDLQTSNLGGNLWSPTGVDVQGSNGFAEQDILRSAVVESDSLVPHIGDMAGHQDPNQLDDFWSSSWAHGQSNCAMPDMAAGAAAANCHWGGYCITC
nr:unnamed protein product [Digitaria exilis]CAB3503327.1 unnamed protein product [Digitaria exilis]